MQVNKSVTENPRAVQEYKYAEVRLTRVLNHVWAAYGKTWLLNGNAGSRESRSVGAITQCLPPRGVEAGSTFAVAPDCNWRWLPQHLDYIHIPSPPSSKRQRQSGKQSDRERDSVSQPECAPLRYRRHSVYQFDVFLTMYHRIDMFQITNLMHNSFILQQYIYIYIYSYRIKELCIKLVIWNMSILFINSTNHGQQAM